MRAIDADALKDGYMHMGYDPNEYPEESYMEGWCKGFNAAVDHCIGHVIHAPTIEPELTWHECFDDDPASFPDNERNVLVSFSNFSLSIIGQWRVDEDGAGCWYLGDTDETFLSEDLFVDGWWELPKKPERRDK